MIQQRLASFVIHTRRDDPPDEDEDERTFPATISSEMPVDRGSYNEILSHAAGAIDLSRAPLPLLESHDAGKVNIGLVQNLRVENGALKGDVKLGSSARAKELGHDIRNRIVRNLSVGYSFRDEDLDWDKDTNTMTANRWKPLEASIVAVPADESAGFYRSTKINRSTQMINDDTSAGDGHLSRSQRIEQRRSADLERSAAAAASTRAADIAALAQRHGQSDRIAGWLASGASVDQVREDICEALGTDPRTMIRGNLGMPEFQSDATRITRSKSEPIPVEELRKYSLLRAIRSMEPGVGQRRAVSEAGFELEVSRHMADVADRQPKGIMVPDEVIFGPQSRDARARLITRAMSAGTASAGGDLVATNLLADEYIQTLNNQPQVFALGARRLDGLVGNTAIPRMTAGSSVHWIGEAGDYGDTTATFDQPAMVPHDLAARTDITRRLLIQSTPAADEIVRNDLALRIGIGIDLAAIAGTGSSNQPTGILNTAGVSVVPLGTNGLAPSWAAMTQVIELLAQDNGLRGNLGWLTNGNVMGTLMRVPVVTGFPRFIWEAGAAGARPDEGSIAGYRALVSNNVPSNLTKGSGSSLSAMIFANWQDLLVGFWRGIDIIADPYSQSSTGTLRITAIQTCDVLVRHPLSFVAILDAITT